MPYPDRVPYDVSVELDGSARGTVDPAPYIALCEQALAAEGVEDATVALLFADDELLWRLNREYRGIDEPTDVLAFPTEGEGEPFPAASPSSNGGPPYLGDIAVAVPQARRQAADAGLSLEEELRHLVLHGLLHLLGYDHETPEEELAMRAREEAVLGPSIHVGGGHAEHGSAPSAP